MDYQQTLDYLFTAAPMFQSIGAGAYKEGLSTTQTLDAHFDHPHHSYKIIHVGGTNGKGSTSHTLAAILQLAGYRVGLYTSPHLVDFRERIRVNGVCISEQRVIDFVEEERAFFEPLHPSFFELTTALAFRYFQEQAVDVAVVEVGLGGRLDCTNIVNPLVSVVTNISFDHINLLGNTLEAIAFEKAGIFKKGVPAVIGTAQPEVRTIFEKVAAERGAKLVYAEEESPLEKIETTKEGSFIYHTHLWGNVVASLNGACQPQNARTIFCTLAQLPQDFQYRITPDTVREGFLRVAELTGLQGRWQIISRNPYVIADTGHNEDAWRHLTPQLEQLAKQSAHPKSALHIVFGACNDKDIAHILPLLPKEVTYYWAQASVHRALPSNSLKESAAQLGLQGCAYSNVVEAYAEALRHVPETGIVFVGGSSFVVADFLSYLSQ